MIEGRGMIAKAFFNYKESKDFFIFASGVSNSQELDINEFAREEKLLLDKLTCYSESVFIYFSTCSIYDSSMINSEYVKHKLAMEKLIESKHSSFYIFRLPQVVGRTESPTIINYLYQKINTNELFDLWDNSTRNLIDVEDVFKIVDYIIQKKVYLNQIINVASPTNIKIKNLVLIVENILNKKGNYRIVDKGIAYEIDISKIEPILKYLQIIFDEKYFKKTILKYYNEPK